MAMEMQSGHDHAPQLALMPTDAEGNAPMATHVAVAGGDWFNPATWAGGEVPGDGALVHIPAGVAVSYEGASDAHLFMVRVDGALTMTAADGAATKMVVDTMITSEGSALVVDARDPGAGTVDLEFAEGVPAAHAGHYADLSPGDGVIGRWQWDPDQLSLGLVASGAVDIKGQDIEARAQLATGPVAGATEIALDVDLAGSGWEVGQKIVIGGVTFADRGTDLTMPTEDEVRTIADLRMDGGRMIVTLDTPLLHDHAGPVDPTTGLELTGYVGNLTRNVTISSAVADGNGDGLVDRPVAFGAQTSPEQHEVTERGHIMFMHNDAVSVHDVALLGLGRTDKSTPVDEIRTGGQHDAPMHQIAGDPNAYEADLDTVVETAPGDVLNMRARYPLHFHMANAAGGHDGHGDHTEMHTGPGVIGPCPETGDPICHCGDQDGDGISDCEDTDVFDGAWAEGVVVWGSPGWGIVQHSTDAVLKGNVVYDVAGSGFVSETGDETGRWEGNLAVGTYGATDLQANTDSEQFNGDGGGSGNGFYLKSRAIEVVDNVAHSSARAGFLYHTEGGDVIDPDAAKLGEMGVLANHADTLEAERVPILGFEGNVVIAAREGLRLLADPLDSVRKFNDAYSHMKDFTAWEIDEAGVSITYSSKYIFENFLVLGTETKLSDAAIQSNAGFYFKASVADITVLNSHVEHFMNAVTNWTQVGDRQEYRRGYWDPKLPAGNQWVEAYDGMGLVEGIENAAYNLWNTNVVGLTWDSLDGGAIRVPAITMDQEDGTTVRERGYLSLENSGDAANPPGVHVELLGDSRDGGLVALWREDIATHPNQEAMLDQHVPLAYQDSVYLSQILREDGRLLARFNYGDHVDGINADIWSGTVLEFAKTDSLGRQVFLYDDFSPLNPESIRRAVTTNERLVFSKDEIDATLVAEGYYHVGGIDDVLFVVMREIFTDRLTGEMKLFDILVALDQAWVMPEGARDAGLLSFHKDMIVAGKYHVFNHGELVEGRAPIVLGPPPNGDFGDTGVTGSYRTDAGGDPGIGADPADVWAGPGGDADESDVLFGTDGAAAGTAGPLDGYLRGEVLEATAGAEVGASGGGAGPSGGAGGADAFVFHQPWTEHVIDDFEDGVDAIGFLIETFRFDDLDAVRGRPDVIFSGGDDSVRVISPEAHDLGDDGF